MARIYVNSYNDYSEIINYAKAHKNKIFELYGVNIIEFIYRTELTEIDFNEDNEHIQEYGGYMISSFPDCITYYLIRNCEIPSIINDLKEEYGDEFEEIKNSEIKIHTFEKFKKYSIKFDYPKNNRMTYSKFGLYWIQIRHNSDSWWWYCEDNDEWVDITKSERYTNTNTAHFGHSLKAVIRKIKKWNLPAGVIITAHGRYRNSNVEIILK